MNDTPRGDTPRGDTPRGATPRSDAPGPGAARTDAPRRPARRPRRTGGSAEPTRVTANVCQAAGCLSAQSGEVAEAIAARLAEAGVADVGVKRVGCLGLCADGPLVRVPQTGERFGPVTPGSKAFERLVARLIAADPGSDPRPEPPPFFARQRPIALENSGRVDPEDLDDYLALGGYAALRKAVTELTPAQVIDELVASGLRGRGGAGFPTGIKWQTVAKASTPDRRYVVCNADEGDPGAFMDRSVLESDPHRVLEGMAIAAYAVGADTGYVYCRAEYPLAVKRLRNAIRLAKRANLLGENIAETGFSFNVDVRLGAGAFVCGEETALLHSIEGRRGTPRPRPPYPAVSGLYGRPTLINNVESFANVAPIIRNGGDWYAQIGVGRSKGTKVFALAGRVVNTGLIEVPMGITLREVVYDIGGGIVDGRPFKAAQTGGPSGGCLPASLLDTPLDYESLAEKGSIVGSGGMIILDDTSCMVDVARYFMGFSQEESCGKCIPCRSGTTQLELMLGDIAEGRARETDLARLEELSQLVKQTSLCGLGQNAPNPIISTLRYFRDEYLSHIIDRVCPAGVCAIAPNETRVASEEQRSKPSGLAARNEEVAPV